MSEYLSYFYGPSGIVSVIFALIMVGSVAMLVRWQVRRDDFDLRDAITAPTPDGKRRVDTSKALLVGTFLVSSYLIADNYSDGALGIYLTAWVVNGGAVLAYKAFAPKPNANEAVKS